MEEINIIPLVDPKGDVVAVAELPEMFVETMHGQVTILVVGQGEDVTPQTHLHPESLIGMVTELPHYPVAVPVGLEYRDLAAGDVYVWVRKTKALKSLAKHLPLRQRYLFTLREGRQL